MDRSNVSLSPMPTSAARMRSAAPADSRNRWPPRGSAVAMIYGSSSDYWKLDGTSRGPVREPVLLRLQRAGGVRLVRWQVHCDDLRRGPHHLGARWLLCLSRNDVDACVHHCSG